MTRLETLRDMLAWITKALAKSQDSLQKHRDGIWNPEPEYITRGEETVAKWIRWRDEVAKLIAELTPYQEQMPEDWARIANSAPKPNVEG